MSLPSQITAGRTVVLVGNPAQASRTAAVARTVASGLSASGADLQLVELADLGAAAVAQGDVRVQDAIDAVGGADLLVLATPVYKAGFTGLLKLFLDQLEPTALESTVTVPVLLTASSAHGALADLQLRLVLQAVGSLLPVPSFVLEEHHLDDLPQYVDAWQRRFGTAVGAVVRALSAEEVSGR